MDASVLMRAYRVIQDAIYSENGADGAEGEAVLEELRPLLSPEDRGTLDHEDIVRQAMPET